MINTCLNKKELLNALNGAEALRELCGQENLVLTDVILTDDGKCCIKVNDAWYATNSNTVMQFMGYLTELYTADEIHEGLAVKFDKKKSKAGREYTLPALADE